MKNKALSLLFFFLSVALFALSQPSFLFEDGLSFCAWFAYIPLFLLLNRIPMRHSFFWGGAYGALSYFCLCWWLSSFGAVALLFVCLLFAFYDSLLFFLLVWAKKVFPPRFIEFFWIFRACLVLSVEFLRTHGIFAFSYGIIGYSQWKNPVFLKFSSLFGIMGVSLVILLFNSIVAKVFFEKNLLRNLRSLSFSFSLLAGSFLFFVFSSFFPEKKSYPIQIALIQNASSAPSRTISDFENDVSLLESLTDAALDKFPYTNLVVWPETAIVPDILYHYSHNSDLQRHELSFNVINYIKNKKTSFIIGNNHRDKDGTHNSALYFSRDSESVGVYNKIHLVPFTEFWPNFLDFKFLDGIKNTLECEFFTPGKEFESFALKAGKGDALLHFSSPICFEDSFPSLIRKMKKNDCDFFVSICDDAWSGSEAARKMHLSMAVFRCAENASPMLRSTVDGITCIIGGDGKILSEIESETDSYLCATVEVPKLSFTLYTVIGDWPFVFLCLAILILLLILSARFCRIKKYGRR